MNNEIDETNKQDDSTSIEIKEGFFSKLFSSFGRKALPPANQPVKTNASIRSLMIGGNLRAALINLGDRLQNIFTPKKEAQPASTLSAHVIGESSKDKNSIDKTKTDDEAVLSAEQPRVFIPQNKSVATSRTTSVMNSVSNQELSVEEIELDSDNVIKTADLAIDETKLVDEKENTQTQQNIQVADITVDNKVTKVKTEKTIQELDSER